MDKEDMEHTMEYYSDMKKHETMPFAGTWMAPEITILGEVSQKEKDKCHIILLICGIKNMIQMNLFTKQNRLTDRKQTVVTKGGEGAE